MSEEKQLFYKTESGNVLNINEIISIKPYSPPCDYGSELKLSDGSKIMLNWGEREKLIDLLSSKGLIL